MPEDVGAFFGGMARSGGRAFESARDYHFLVAQAAYQNTLKQQQADLADKTFALQQKEADQRYAEANFRLEQAKELEKTVDLAAETLAPKPSVAGTGVKAIRAGKKVSLQGIQRAGKEAAGQRALVKLGLKKAPGQVLFPEEPAEKIFSSGTLGIQRYTREGGLETLLAPPEEAPKKAQLKTSDIKNAYDIASEAYTKAEWEDLDRVEVVRAANAVGRDNVENWVDQTVNYDVKFKNIPWGKDKMKTIRATPEQIDIIREAEKDRDNEEITQADFEELLEDVLAEE